MAQWLTRGAEPAISRSMGLIRNLAARRVLLVASASAAIALLAATPAGAGQDDAAARFNQEYRELRQESVDGIERQLEIARVQVVLVGAALGWLLHGIWLAKTGRRPSARTQRTRRVIWAVLALLSIASFYRFSLTDRVRHDMHIKDAYHYFIGGKYFPELGYGRLYSCTLAVAAEQNRWWLGQIDAVRNLRTMLPQPTATALAAGRRDCRPRFSAARWAQFGRDLGWFFERIEGPVWRRTLNDFGFNPSPVWSLIALPITRFAPADALPILVQLDTLLVLAALAALGWAFGFEAMGLAAIAWGTGFLWRYTWVGDAFLRQVWFASALIGIACLGRRRAFAGGAALAISAGVRLFPAIFAVGYAAHALQRFWAERVWQRDATRFALGLLLCGWALGIAALIAGGHGWQTAVDFAHNTMALRDVAARNMAGLPALLWRIDGTTALQWADPTGAHWISASTSAAIRWGALLASGMVFWRTLPHSEAWESAALGFALIPLWVAPTGYYFHFSVLAAVLAVRRPWIGVALAVACLGWLANGLVWRDLGSQFTTASAIAVALSITVLAAMLRPVRSDPSDLLQREGQR